MELRKDQKSSLFFLFFAAAILFASVEASLGSFSAPGSGLLPFLAALLLAVFALLNLISATMRKGEKERRLFSFSEINWKNLGAALGALFVFPFSLETLGFTVTVFGFVLLLSKVVSPTKWLNAIAFAAAATVACYLLFVYWLKFVVGKGILGF